MTTEERSTKYSYKYRLEAPKVEEPNPEVDRIELQAYINEVLGISRPRIVEKDILTA
jgi:hypothetical protein